MRRACFSTFSRCCYAALASLILFAAWLSLPRDASAAAQLVIESAERERWHGEDNLYGEWYGNHVAMDTGRMVTAGRLQAIVWEYDFTDGWQPVQVLHPDGFGTIRDVAIHGDWIVFGHTSPYQIPGSEDGGVSVFRNTGPDGWVQHSSWPQPDNSVTGYEVHYFGTSVDIEGDVLMVGAPSSRDIDPPYDDGPGFVFIYVWDGAGWVYADYLTSDDADPWRYFGASIDLEGGRLIVGAPRQDNAGPNAFGAAFVFEGSGASWSRELISPPIYTPDPFDDYNYARHVANDGGRYLVVAADEAVRIIEPTDEGYIDQVVNLSGRQVESSTDGVDFSMERVLYIDSANQEVVSILPSGGTWQESETLPSAGLTTEPYGVAIDGSYAAVGYPLEDAAGWHTGITIPYLSQSPYGPLEVDGEPLSYGDAEPGDDFGRAVAAALTGYGAGNAGAIVGAPNDSGGVGAAYIYNFDALEDEWTKSERWQPEGLDENAGFGAAVAYAEGGRRAAGAPWDREPGTGDMLGSVHVYHPDSGFSVLTSPVPNELYGVGLAYIGDVLIAGAPAGKNNSGTETGLVYAYQHDSGTGWGAPDNLGWTGITLTPFAELGAAVSTDGQWLLVGAPGDQRDGANAGAAFVWELTGSVWTPRGRLETGNITPNDRFGEAVAVWGDYLVVGAPGEDSEAGAAHLFQYTGGTWTYVTGLTAADAQAGDGFGASLHLDAKNLFVGAPGVDVGPTNVGAVYPYRLSGTTWAPAVDRIVHDNPVQDDMAGVSLAFASDMLLTGAPGEDGAETNAGAVILYDYRAHIEVPSPMNPGPGKFPCYRNFRSDFDQRFVSPIDPAATSHFGEQIDVSGDTMVVGEIWAEHNQQSGRYGAVHVYRRTEVNAWTLEEKIYPPVADLPNVSQFGITVAIDGDLLAIGQWNGYWVYVYERTPAGWVFRTHILNPSTSNAFGAYSLDISGSTVMVGDPGYNIPTSGVGAVHFYDRTGENSWAPLSDPLLSSDAQLFQKFGYRVALDKATGRAVATVGTSSATPRTAYLIELIGGQWQETGKLTPAGASNLFGSDADLDGSTVVIGDRSYVNPGGPGIGQGAAFVWAYDGSVWTGPDILLGSEPGPSGDATGSSVAIDEDIIVLGAPSAYATPGGPRPGVAYVFARANGAWSERLRIVPADLTLRYYGDDVAVSGGVVAAGTYYGSSATPNTGVVYAYDMECTSSELAADFGSNGLWHYDGTSWIKLTGQDPGNGGLAGWSGGLAANFDNAGVWSYDGTGWVKLTGLNPGSGGLTGWADGMAGDFDSNGIWTYDGTSWSKLTGSNPITVEGWSGGLAAAFASGIWNYDGTSWTRLTAASVGDGGIGSWSGGLAADFDSAGVWSYDGTSWVKLTGSSPDSGGLSGWAGGLAGDFDSSGVWTYDGTSWIKINPMNVGSGGLSGWGSELAGDFDAAGVWSYDGTNWWKMTDLNAQAMDAVDLY